MSRLGISLTASACGQGGHTYFAIVGPVTYVVVRQGILSNVFGVDSLPTIQNAGQDPQTPPGILAASRMIKPEL